MPKKQHPDKFIAELGGATAPFTFAEDEMFFDASPYQCTADIFGNLPHMVPFTWPGILYTLMSWRQSFYVTNKITVVSYITTQEAPRWVMEELFGLTGSTATIIGPKKCTWYVMSSSATLKKLRSLTTKKGLREVYNKYVEEWHKRNGPENDSNCT